MPELPEVETVKNCLLELVLNKKIINVSVFFDKILQNISSNDFINKLKGKTIVDIKRIGKYLIFILSEGCIVSHLRMEGKYFLKNDTNFSKHDHIIFYFDDGSNLRYNDTRKFGTMHYFNNNDLDYLKKLDPLNKLGPDANSDYTLDYLKEKFNKNKPIKELLLDQSIISGIGNIYADEVIFLSGLYPLTKGNMLSIDDIERIKDSSKYVLNKAISLGGTTIKSFVSSHNITGRFQNELSVHTKEKCKLCNNDIKVIKVNGRSTYYCPNCQKEKI